MYETKEKWNVLASPACCSVLLAFPRDQRGQTGNRRQARVTARGGSEPTRTSPARQRGVPNTKSFKVMPSVYKWHQAAWLFVWWQKTQSYKLWLKQKHFSAAFLFKKLFVVSVVNGGFWSYTMQKMLYYNKYPAFYLRAELLSVLSI